MKIFFVLNALTTAALASVGLMCMKGYTKPDVKLVDYNVKQ